MHAQSKPTAEQPPSPVPARRSWRRRLLAVLFGFVFAMLLAELALRVIGYSSPVFMRPHPIYGAAFKPGIQGWYRLEGKSWSGINSHGFNAAEWTVAKPPNTFRIVILGDSYIAAQQVEQQASICQELRRQLEQSGALGEQKIEVLNCGCNGYGTAQQLLVWREQARHFQADLVLLAFLPGNDLCDNYRPLTINSVMRPYFKLNSQQELELDNSFLNDEEYVSRQTWISSLQYFVVDHFRLAQLLNLFRLSHIANTAPLNKTLAEQAARSEIGIGVQVYQTPTGVWSEAWDITRRLLYQLQHEVLATGTRFGVICLTMGDQTNPDAEHRAAFAKILKMPDLLEPERQLEKICANAEPPIPLLPLAPGLLKIAEEKQVAMHGWGEGLHRGHWNENGHRYAGQLIAEWLQTQPELLGKPAAKPQ